MEDFWSPLTVIIAIVAGIGWLALVTWLWKLDAEKSSHIRARSRPPTRDISNLDYSPEPGDEFEGGIRYNAEP
ncbi:unnamed protein product, partial [marine sediment metagenome]